MAFFSSHKFLSLTFLKGLCSGCLQRQHREEGIRAGGKTGTGILLTRPEDKKSCSDDLPSQLKQFPQAIRSCGNLQANSIGIDP